MSQMDLPLAQLCTCLLKPHPSECSFSVSTHHTSCIHYWCSTISSKHPGNLASEHFPQETIVLKDTADLSLTIRVFGMITQAIK